MIPKIIHYTWFSNDPMPFHIQELMKTWKEILPDYEFILWDGKKLAEVNNTFANEAASVGKWAFAADYIRCYAVYHYGGIYLDTDIEVFKSFNPYLACRMFIGGEANFHERPKKRYLTAHVFGAEKHHPFLKDCLEYYKDRHFIDSYNKELPLEFQYDMTISPIIFGKIATVKYGYNANGYFDEKQILKEDIHVFPSDYFDVPRYNTMKRVVCIHRAVGGWRNNNNSNQQPDYSSTNPYKKGIKWFIYLLYDKFNFIIGKYLHIQIIKVGDL